MMNKEEILNKAIEKSKENGLEMTNHIRRFGNSIWDFDGNLIEPDYNIIFSHSFAKAFWKNYKSEGYWLWCKKCNKWAGEAIWHEYPIYHGDCGKKLERKEKFDDYEWQNQLQNMVLEENPLEYLAKFLKGK